jgi:predicted metal-dependent phosphoesterase TrpH
MWRTVDLHFHTNPNERSTDPFDAQAAIDKARAEGVDVLVIADHDTIEHVSAMLATAADINDIDVLPGAELTTDRGHMVMFGGIESLPLLEDFLARTGAHPGVTRPFVEILSSH